MNFSSMSNIRDAKSHIHYIETLQLYVHQFDSAYLITLSIQTSVHQGRCTNPLPEKA